MSDELARTNHTNTGNNDASSSATHVTTDSKNDQQTGDMVVDSISQTPIFNVVIDSTVVTSPNKFNVLSDELGLTNFVQHSSDQVEESSDDDTAPEQASSGVKGSKWGECQDDNDNPKVKRKPGRVRVSKTQQNNIYSASKSDSETEINELGIRVQKGFSLIIQRRVLSQDSKDINKPTKSVS